MPYFVYEAIDPSTNKVTGGKLEADNIRAAKEVIRQQGVIPTKIEEDRSGQNVSDLLATIPILGDFLAPKMSGKELTIMTQQMYTLLEAGIPLIESLYLLEQQADNPRAKQVLKKVRSDVIAGDSFSSAISRFPREFNKLYVNMIRAGEVSGELDSICERLASLLDKEMTLRGKVKGALVMPAVTVIIIVIVIVVILVFVVPVFEGVFSRGGAELPVPTLILLACSKFIMNFWWALILAIGTVTVWFNIFRQGAGKPFVDQWLLTLPIFGTLLNQMYVSSFIRTLATLLGSGVSLTEGLVTAAATMDNYVMLTTLDKARETVMIGGSLSKPLEQSKVFPFMVVKMIAVGEETGSIENMLIKAATFLDREVDETVDNMTKLIEPLMTVILGIILLGVALALYLPMWEMNKHVG